MENNFVWAQSNDIFMGILFIVVGFLFKIIVVCKVLPYNGFMFGNKFKHVGYHQLSCASTIHSHLCGWVNYLVQKVVHLTSLCPLCIMPQAQKMWPNLTTLKALSCTNLSPSLRRETFPPSPPHVMAKMVCVCVWYNYCVDWKKLDLHFMNILFPWKSPRFLQWYHYWIFWPQL